MPDLHVLATKLDALTSNLNEFKDNQKDSMDELKIEFRALRNRFEHDVRTPADCLLVHSTVEEKFRSVDEKLETFDKDRIKPLEKSQTSMVRLWWGFVFAMVLAFLNKFFELKGG